MAVLPMSALRALRTWFLKQPEFQDSELRLTLFRQHPKKASVGSSTLEVKIYLAVSGGVDSLFLFQGAWEIFSPQYLHVIHVHHGQHELSDEALSYVEKICSDRNIEFSAIKLQLAPGASEEILREARYQALGMEIDRISSKEPGEAKDLFQNILCTGHHFDDQAEELLMRLLRGAHPENFQGIPSRDERKTPKGRKYLLLRPLLGFKKQELIKSLQKSSLEAVEDPTSSDSRFLRNAVRAQVEPVLTRLWPQWKRHLISFSEALVRSDSLKNEWFANPLIELKDILSKNQALSKVQWTQLKTGMKKVPIDRQSRTVQFLKNYEVNLKPRKILLFRKGSLIKSWSKV